MERARTTGGELIKSSVLLTPEQDALIDKLAKARLTSRAAVMREMIAIGLRAQRVGAAAQDAAVEAVA